MGFLVANGVVALLALVGVFIGLPNRWLWVDVPTVLLAALWLATAPAYVLPRARRLRALARVSAWLTLGVGITAVFALGLTAGFLTGVSGEVAHGGVIAFSLVLVTVFTYLIAYPMTQLWWLAR